MGANLPLRIYFVDWPACLMKPKARLGDQTAYYITNVSAIAQEGQCDLITLMTRVTDKCRSQSSFTFILLALKLTVQI